MSDFETIRESELQCPYCGYVDDEYYLGDSDTDECGGCGKKYHVEREVMYSSSGDCELNNEEHDFVHSGYEDLYNCSKCAQYKTM